MILLKAFLTPYTFSIIKEFQNAEECGPGEQRGDQLPREVSEEAGGKWRKEGTN